VKRLDDVDRTVLAAMVARSVALATKG